MARRRRPPRVGPLTNIWREPGAWSVVLTRKGRRFPEYFGDAVWGGRGRALLAAQRFRDQLLLRIEPDTRVRRRPARGSRSKTGVVGVIRERHVVDGRSYWRYVASWRDPDEGAQRRRFYERTYGKEEAKALAIEARETGVARSHARMMDLQREAAAARLDSAPPAPRPVKDPLSRKGINMGGRRPRRAR